MSKTKSRSYKKGQTIRRSLRNVDVENINKELAKINECKTNENDETMDQNISNTAKLSKKRIFKSNLKIKSSKNNKYFNDSESDYNQNTGNKSKRSIPIPKLKKKSSKNNKYLDDSESDDSAEELTKVNYDKTDENDEFIDHIYSGDSDDSESDDSAEELINMNSGKTKSNKNSVNQSDSIRSTRNSVNNHKSSLKRRSGRNMKYCDDTKSSRITEKLLDDSNEKSADESYPKYRKNKKAKTTVKNYTAKSKQTKTVKKSADEENSSDELSDTEYDVQKIVEVKLFKNGKREFLIRWKGYKAEDDTWEKEENLNCKELLQTFLENLEQNKNLIDRELRPQRTATKRLIMNVDHLKRRSSKRPHKEINYQED